MLTEKEKRKIRILQVTPWFPPHIGGIASYVSNLCMRMISEGYNISVLTVKRMTEDQTNGQNINIDYVNCFSLPGWPYATMKSLSIPIDAGLKLDSTIRNGKFDIIHVHGIHYPISWLAIYLAHRYGIRSIISLHGTYPVLNQNKETTVEKWLYKHLFSRVLSLAGAVIGPAECITSFAQAQAQAKSSSRTLYFTIQYGVDTAQFVENLHRKAEYRKRFSIADNAIVLIFSSRFEKIKGVMEFCIAVKKIIEEGNQNVEAIIVGSGTLKKQINSVVGNTTGIHLFDWQPKDKMHEFYIASDIMVVPSSSEGVPITILEGMNAGLHIVYCPVGGASDVLKGYQMKTQLDNNTTPEIHGVLHNLICNGSDAIRMSSLRYAQNFDWKYVTEQIIGVYQRLLTEKLSSLGYVDNNIKRN